MKKIQHPWQVGPTELIDFALERMHKGSDFDRRLAFLILDVGVETLFKTYLNLPDSVTQFRIKRSERNAALEGNFHELLRGVQSSEPQRASSINFAHIEHYHNLRNTLYHQGNQVTTIPMSQLEGYAKLAVTLLKTYLEVDLSRNLKRPASPHLRVEKSEITYPLHIQAMHKKEVYKAELLNANGTIRFDGKEYPKPTTAAKAIATSWKEVNGWDF